MSESDRARSFDRVADLYDRLRPGYPEALFDEIATRARLRPGDPVLEIGAGTGRASVPFLARGYRLRAIEPGENLVRAWRRRTAPFGDVPLDRARFEEVDLPPASFAVVFAAQAFHWLDRATRLARIAAALRPGGHLAVFGNAPRRGDRPIDAAIQEAYQRHWPGADEGAGPRAFYDALDSPILVALRGSAAFSEPFVSQYTHSVRYDAGDYASLLRTHSDHQTLPPRTLDALVGDIEAAIRGHGGAHTITYACTLFLSQRADLG